MNSNHDDLQAALEAGFEKPSKIRKRSPGETLTPGRDARSSSPISSDIITPSTPVANSGKLPLHAVAEVATASTSDRQVKVKAEPVHFESSKAIAHIPSTMNKTAGGLATELEGKPNQAVDNSGMYHCSFLVGVVHLVQSRYVSVLGLARLLQVMSGFSFVKRRLTR